MYVTYTVSSLLPFSSVIHVVALWQLNMILLPVLIMMLNIVIKSGYKLRRSSLMAEVVIIQAITRSTETAATILYIMQMLDFILTHALF